MNAIANTAIDKAAQSPETLDFWSRRYLDEGHIWGDDGSITAQILAEKLAESDDASVKTILEVGFGYGRDIKELAIQGHKIVGIETASAALHEAANQVGRYLQSGQVQLLLGDFNHTNYLKRDFDAVSCHRTLHLWGNNGLVRAFANKTASVLKDHGLLAVSARNLDDFNPEQMVMIGNNLAEYKARPGHQISFWNEERFRETFSKKFDILEFHHGVEIEAQKNPVDSHFTLMIARKKPEPPTPVM